MEPALEILRGDLAGLGLPLRRVEGEFGPSQCEITFAAAGRGLPPADTMVLFRAAVKQSARRHGYHVTFMCRPKLPNVFSSGWHLHQSLLTREERRERLHASGKTIEVLNEFGRKYFFPGCWRTRARQAPSPRRRSTATSDTAPIRWRPSARSGAATTAAHDAGRRRARRPRDALENRIGEPAANPYLYMASQILSGLDGVDRKLDPGP